MTSFSDQVLSVIRAGLQASNPGMDIGPGSAIDRNVLAPIQELLGSSFVDVPVAQFIEDRMRQELPSLAFGPGDARTAMFGDPLRVVLEPVQAQIRAIKPVNLETTPPSLEAAMDIASNFFVTPRTGTPSTGVVRVYFSQAGGVIVPTTARLATGDGLVFRPTHTQTFPVEVVSRQRVGTEFYVDVSVRSEVLGVEGGVGVGTITRISGVQGATRCSNISDMSAGDPADTPETLIERVRLDGLSQRTLVNRMGIAARIREVLPSVSQVEITGSGDAEMMRDVLEGESHGAAVATGIAFLVGRVGVFFCGWEGPVPSDGSSQVRVGDRVDLNFWPFLYNTEHRPDQKNQLRTVEAVLWDSRASAASTLPSVILAQLDSGPDIPAPAHPSVPGVYPGVMFYASRPGAIRIGGLPGGVLEPDGTGSLEVDDGVVHLGGKVDVWVRAGDEQQTTGTTPKLRSPDARVEGIDLYTNGDGERAYRSSVHRTISVTLAAVSGTIGVGDVIRGQVSGFIATVYARSGNTATLVSCVGLPEAGETIRAKTSSATATVSAVAARAWEEDGVGVGDAIVILSGTDTGTYRIGAVDGPYAFLDVDLAHREGPILYRVVSACAVNIFSPRSEILPFGDYSASDLRTTVGSATVNVGRDVTTYGVTSGDTLEILSGYDAGSYTVRGFDSVRGGLAPILDRALGSTASGVSYKVYRTGIGIARPMVRLLPGGVRLVDDALRATGTTIPPAHPVEARAITGFSGSHAIATGTGGFVLPDPGGTWAPSGPRTITEADSPDARACYSEECVDDVGGVIAVCTLLDDGRFYLDANLPAGATQLLQDIKSFLLGLDDTFGFGAEFRELVSNVLPLEFGAAESGTSIVLQYEILLPYELFDGVQNTWVALPDIDWARLFRSDGVEEALASFRTGASAATPSALHTAKAGDVLVIHEGANRGAWVIARVDQYHLATIGSIEDGVGDVSRAYPITVVTIAGEFPAAAVGGLSEFFSAGGLEDLAELPAPPVFPGSAVSESGASISAWEMIGTAMDWLFQWLNRMGFDLPTTFELDTSSMLESIWQMLFSRYSLERPSGASQVRLYWQEPTSVTLYPATPTVTWLDDHPEQRVSMESAQITLPLPELEGSEIVIYIDGEELATVASASAGTATTLAALANILQQHLDSAGIYVEITGPATDSGVLTLDAIWAGTAVTLDVRAATSEDTLRLLGYYDDGTANPPEILATDPPSSTPMISRITKTAGAHGGFRLVFVSEISEVGQDVDVLDELVTGSYWYTKTTAAIQDAVAVALAAAGITLTCAVSEVDGGITMVFSGVSDIGTIRVEPALGIDNLAGEFFYGVLPSGGNGFAGGSITLSGEGFSAAITVSGTSPSAWSIHHAYSGDDIFAIQSAVNTYHSSGDEDTGRIASALNRSLDARKSSGVVRYQWVGGPELPLKLRGVDGAAGAEMTLEEGDLQAFLGVPAQTVEGGGGVSNNFGGFQATETTREFRTPEKITRFVATSGSRILEYVVCDAPDGPSLRAILPALDGDAALDLTRWPRDLVVADAYEGAESAILLFEDSAFPSPHAAGCRPGDILAAHPQRCVRGASAHAGQAGGLPDVLIGVRTYQGTTTLRLPVAYEPAFTFLSPEEGGEAVEVGDIVSIEAGPDAGIYKVTDVTDDTLTVDSPLSATTLAIFRSGRGAGVAAGGHVVRISATHTTFQSTDVGRWLTVWGSDRVLVSGSWRVTAVSRVSDGSDYVWEITLDMATDFPTDEVDLDWALVAPPGEDPGESLVGDATELLGVVPIRIYRGTVSEWRVSAVDQTLDRTAARLRVALNSTDTGSISVGVRAPYRILRPGEVRIPVSQMRVQREGPLYYVDVWAKSLGGSPDHNLASGERLEIVRGTYDADGYWLQVADTRYTFSALEDTTLWCSPFLLPVGADDSPTSLVAVEGMRISLDADWSSAANTIQELVTNPGERPLVADFLVRSFIPSYVSVDLQVRRSAASASAVAEAIRAYINNLSSVDALSLPQIQSTLTGVGVSDYVPPTLTTLTHDLDRNIVGSRTTDTLADDEIPYNGSDRVTTWRAGPDASAATGTQPPGERIRVTVGVSRFRS